MSFRSLPLPADVRGALWLSSMPGRLEPWAAFLAEAQRHGLTRIVCLTPLEEVAAHSPAYRAAIDRGELPCPLTLLPMRNFGLAHEAQAFRTGVSQLAADLAAGEVALLHCAAGIGRTGTTAACVLKCLGMSTHDALQQVRLAGSNPETAAQSGLIDMF
jgi:hypothetical protein